LAATARSATIAPTPAASWRLERGHAGLPVLAVALDDAELLALVLAQEQLGERLPVRSTVGSR
jgi:hypothetical protein